MNVTIITPTTEGRSKFLQQCRKYVEYQDYTGGYIEHFIVHGDEAIGAKINKGIRETTGGIIIRFDDDDVYSKDYVSRVVAFFTCRPNVQVTGIDRIYYLDIVNGWVYTYRYIGKSPKHLVLGSGSAFRRELFDRVSYPALSIGEDTELCKIPGVVVEAMPYDNNVVALLHGDNTSSGSNMGNLRRIIDTDIISFVTSLVNGRGEGYTI